jgi:hypothetical protein
MPPRHPAAGTTTRQRAGSVPASPTPAGGLMTTHPCDGLNGVMGDTPLVAVDMIGDRLVGEVTESDERLSNSIECSMIFSGSP